MRVKEIARYAIRAGRRDPIAAAAVLVLLSLVFAAVAAPQFTPHDPVERNIAARLQPPGSYDSLGGLHALGTDEMGRDLLTRLIYGARVSLIVGLTVPVAACAMGMSLGIAAGLLGGIADSTITIMVDMALSFPFILLSLAIISVTGAGLRNIILVLAVTTWPAYARVARAETLALRNRGFVLAARSIGATEMRIAWRHLLPNLLPSIIVLISMQSATAILAEASLSFFGMGVPAPTPSWGAMLAEGRQYVDSAWWMTAFAGLAIAITALCLNLLGDRLRDTLDPKHSG